VAVGDPPVVELSQQRWVDPFRLGFYEVAFGVAGREPDANALLLDCLGYSLDDLK